MLQLLTDFTEILRFVCNSMLHFWHKMLLKSDICLSYNKVHRGLLFSGHGVLSFNIRRKYDFT